MPIPKKNKNSKSWLSKCASGSILWKFLIIFERSDFKKILFEIFWPLKESKPGEVSNDNSESVETEVNNTLMPPKENEDRYTSTPERTRIDAKGYPFLETFYPLSRFKSSNFSKKWKVSVLWYNRT